MPQAIIYPGLNGGVVIGRPTCNITPEIAERLSRGRPYAIVETDSIPSDQTFRNAWQCTFSGNIPSGILVNIERAKDIARDQWSRAAEPLLTSLNNQYVEALLDDDSNLQTQIASRRQSILDALETDLSTATTTGEIKAAWPDILNG